MVLFSAVVSAGEVKQVMKDMKHHYDSAIASRTLADFTKYEAAFQDDVVRAGSVNYSADPATYQQGMKALQNGLQPVRQAMAAGDLPGAKQALSKLMPVKKRYHNLLN